MYAPCFPEPRKNPNPCWHRVHPLDLTYTECHRRQKVRILSVQDSVPRGAPYCSWCAKLDEMDAHRNVAGQQVGNT